MKIKKSFQTIKINIRHLFVFAIIFLFVLVSWNNDGGSEEFNFAVTGHVYSNPNDFDYILRYLDGKDMKVLFVGGDIENNILDKLDNFESDYNVRVIPAPGNHELQDSVSEESYYERFGNFKTIEISGVNFIILNTVYKANHPYPHGGSSIDGDQLEFLCQELSRLNGRPVSIIMHHALWAADISEDEKLKIASTARLNNKYALEDIQFPGNDTAPNNWMQKVHPLLRDYDNFSVFSGDASLSSSFVKDGVNYYATGLRQREKGAWVEGNMQSFLQCSFKNKKISCHIEYFPSSDNFSSQENIYEKFINTLKELMQEKSYVETIPLINGEVKLNRKLENVKYLSVEKDPHCSFPIASFTVDGGGIYDSTKSFEDGIAINENTKFYFINNKEDSVGVIDEVYFYRLDNPIDECENYKVSFFDYNFVRDIEVYKKIFPEFSIEISDNDYRDMQNLIPTEEERYTSDFKFEYVRGLLKSGENDSYGVNIKNRGGTAFHWIRDKKSYTIKFDDWYQKMKKMLFYVPDKRAYTGEFLVNKISKIIGLNSLNSSFGNLTINGKNYGTYYVSEDFEESFLAKRNLPEANIYNTDPYKISAIFDIESIKKDVFMSTINDYEKDYNRDIDFFLSVIKKDTETLGKNWEHYFHPDNLAKILAIYSITGTFHYDLHNMVFYINPSDGRIYFFPWDFMNYTNAGNLNRENLELVNNDFLNLNQIFSHLLEVPEIRDKRNQVISEYSDEIIKYLDNFYVNENVRLFSNFLTDQTAEFYVGEGNRPTLVSLMEIPKIIKDNTIFLTEKISKDILESQFFIERTSNKIKLSVENNGFSTEKIKNISLTGQNGEIVNIFVDGKVLSKESFDIERANLLFNVSFDKNIILNPRLEYKKEYASPIFLKPGHKLIEFIFTEPLLNPKITITFENISTQQASEINSKQQIKNIERQLSINQQDEKYFEDILLKKVGEGNEFKFISQNIKIERDLILPSNTKLLIDPGAKIEFGRGASLISFGEIEAIGTAENPIIFTNYDKKGWGVLALVHEKSKGNFKHCLFENGNDAQFGEIYFSGMLSGYFGDVNVDNCMFRLASRNGGDDAVNFKNGYFQIENSSFIENKFDAIDYDYSKTGSYIKNNIFQKNGNDGIDVSGSKIQILNNKIKESGDKCISIGENSDILIENNLLEKCNLGISAKDSSTVIFANNELYENKIGVAAYNKKEYFGGASIEVYNSIFKDNGQDFGIEIIDSEDFRINNNWYNSSCIVYNSLYNFSEKTTREIIKYPKEKKTITKKQVLKAYLLKKLNKIGYKFALLINKAKEASIDSNSPYSNSAIGIIKEDIKNP